MHVKENSLAQVKDHIILVFLREIETENTHHLRSSITSRKWFSCTTKKQMRYENSTI